MSDLTSSPAETAPPSTSTASAGTSLIYDGFVSYSHAKDKAIAAALQSAMQRLGKSWYRRRALRLFRDDTSLSASPHLWPSIEQALGQSRFLILMASPEAAASRWVGQEISWWLEHKSADTLLIGLTEGRLLWDHDVGDFSWSVETPLPAVLRGRFATDPRWIDLRPYREHSSPRDAKFTDLAAEFAATLHGKPKEDLLSLEVRQQRRALTLAWSATTLLFVLFAIAGWQWRVANIQASETERQRDNVLAELSAAELSRGAIDSALKLAVHGTRLSAQLKQAAGTPSRPSVELTAAVWQTGWQHVLAHRYAVNASQFSPDGKRIVTASGEEAWIWDAADGGLIGVFHHGVEVGSAAFSPDGTRIVTAADKTARIWDVSNLVQNCCLATGQEIGVFRGHENTVFTAAFSPDGTRIVTASADKTARIWDAATFKEIAVLSGHEGSVLTAAFSPDGTRIVTASSDRTARIWDAATFKEIAVLRNLGSTTWDPSSFLASAGFSPDGTRIITVAGWEVGIWDAKSMELVGELRGNRNEPLISAAISPDGSQIVSVGLSRSARIWDVETRRDLGGLLGHESTISRASFAPDGKRIVTASSDGTARIWDTAPFKKDLPLPFYAPTSSAGAFSPDGSRVVLPSRDGAVIWDAATAKEIGTIVAGRAVRTAAFSHDGTRIVTATGELTARVWDATTLEKIAELRGHEEKVLSATFSPDGSRIVTASTDRTARVWDAVTANLLGVLHHDDTVLSAAFSPDGTRIVTASADKTARIWDAATFKEIAVLRGHSEIVLFGAFSPDGAHVVTASADRTARVWDIATAHEIAVFRGTRAPFRRPSSLRTERVSSRLQRMQLRGSGMLRP